MGKALGVPKSNKAQEIDAEKQQARRPASAQNAVKLQRKQLLFKINRTCRALPRSHIAARFALMELNRLNETLFQQSIRIP